MWRFAIRNLVSRPTRSLLSLLGLTVAIAGMVGLFSVAEGLDEMVSATFRRIPGLLAMQPGAPMPLFSRIPADWEREIAAVDGVQVVNAEIWQRVNLIESKVIVSPPRFLFGTNIASRLRLEHGVYRDEIVDGRFLTLDDRGTLNVLVSRQIADEFQKGVGDTLRVSGHDFHIVGVYHCGSILLDVAIILDIEQARQITRFNPNSVSCFYIEQREGADPDELAERIRSVFRGRKIEHWQPLPSMGLAGEGSGNVIEDVFNWLDRNLKLIPRSEDKPEPADNQRGDPAPAAEQNANTNPAAPDRPVESLRKTTDTIAEVDETIPLEVRSAVDWAARFDKFTQDLDILLTVITAIGVTIAVLSIVNTMLMSVTERIIEFGILKANGWSKTDVMRLITYESAILGLGGGLLGSLAGWTATQIINFTWPTQVHLFASPQLLTFSVFFSSMLGVLGGVYPAVWAMRMMPMDAIRRG